VYTRRFDDTLFSADPISLGSGAHINDLSVSIPL
jgi:hypothetical protein